MSTIYGNRKGISWRGLPLAKVVSVMLVKDGTYSQLLERRRYGLLPLALLTVLIWVVIVAAVFL